jgi:predicted AAA+ superfamily ATPase
MLIKRELMEAVIKHLKEPEITLLVGARQVGKTMLLKMLKEYLVEEEKMEPECILFFNLDIVKDWELFQNQPDFISYLRSRAVKKLVVMVDEAQKVPNCASFFKGVYDSQLPVKLVLSGSASFELKSKLKESLSGRKKVFNLESFSFLEYLKAKDLELCKLIKNGKSVSHPDRRSLISHYKKYLLWGGYPRVVLSKTNKQKIDILAEIYSSYIDRDIVGFLEVKNKLRFSNLVKLLAGQIGSLINLSELSASSGLDRDTTERYLNALTETFVITPLYPYYTNPQQEIIKQNKYYFKDSGIRNYAQENYAKMETRADRGFLFENNIMKELVLLRNPFTQLRFWRTKQGAEVDFIVVEQRSRLIPVEAKLQLNKPSVSLGLRSFIKKFNPKKAVVVNLGIYEQEMKVDRTRVFFVHPFELDNYLS